jgi:hypothetical protein
MKTRPAGGSGSGKKQKYGKTWKIQLYNFHILVHSRSMKVKGKKKHAERDQLSRFIFSSCPMLLTQ